MLFKIDFTRPHLYEDVVTLNQGNLSTNNTLRCRIATGGNDDVTGASIVCTFVINGKQIFESGKVVDGPRGIVDVIFPSEALVVGENTLEFLVNRIDGSVAQSPVIKYRVWQGLTTDEGVRADSNYPLLVELINQANSAVNSANEALEGANSVIAQGDELKASVDKLKADCIASVDSFTEENSAKIDNAISQNVAKVDAAIVKSETSVVKANAATEKAILAANNSDTKTAENIKKVNAAIAAGTQDLEVKAARVDMDGVEHGSLKERLESDLKKGKLIEETKEGTYLSFNDTVGGIVSDIEVFGNTVQDISNLANIRSSCIPNGDGTFKMSILSCGENLFGSKFELGTLDTTTGLPAPRDSRIRSVDYTRVNSNTNYCISDNLNYTWVIYEYDNSNKFVKLTVTTSAKKTITTSPTTRYIKIRTEDTQIDLNVKCKLQEGTVATPYAPYEETRCDIKLPCQLEKVYGLGQDKLYFDEFENAWCIDKNIITLDFIPTVLQQDFTNSNLLRMKIDGVLKYQQWQTKQALFNKEELVNSKGWDDVANIGKIATIISSANCDLICPKSITTLQQGVEYSKGIIVKGVTLNPQKIVLPQSEQIKLNSFANKTYIYTISGEVDATVKATVSKSLASTVQANTNEINILNGKIEDIQGLKESQDFEYETDKGYLVCKDTQNGVVKDLKVYGKSLVNKSKIKTTSFEGRIVSLFSNNGTLNGFTIVADVTKNTTSKGIALSLTDVDGIITYPLLQNANTVGKAIWYFNKKIKDISMYQQLDDYGADKAIVDNIMILEGDQRNNLPNGYFEGIASVGNGNGIEVLSVNENLANVTVVENKIWGTDGILSDSDGSNAISEMISVISNINYTLSCNSVLASGNVRFFDSNKKYIGQVFNGKFQTPSNCKFIVWFSSSEKLPKDGKVMLEIGDIISNYVEPKQDKKTILFKDTDNTWKPVLNLRGIDENNCDIIDTVNNVFENNVLEVIFNGDSSENWSLQKTENGKSQFTMSAKRTGIKPNSKILSDKYNNITSSQFTNMEVGVFNGSAWGLVINDPSVTDVQSLKAKLQSNNIKVNVQLLEGKTYEINPIFPNSYENETMISFGSGVIAPYASWKITSSLPNFVQNIEDRVCRLENDAYKVNLANFAVALNMLDMKARLESLEAPIN